MIKAQHYVAAAGLFGSTLLGGLTLSGCSDEQHTTGTLAERPPAAAAGEKASMEHMKAMMGKGGKTKTQPAAAPKAEEAAPTEAAAPK